MLDEFIFNFIYVAPFRNEGESMTTKVTSSSAIAQRPRCRVGIVMAKSGRLELGNNIYGHYRSIFNHCDVIGQQSNQIRLKTQNKGYYGVQGHSRSSRSVSIVSPYATSY